MNDWTHGYVAEVGYTLGYYSELNPLRLAVPFLNVGLMPPTVATACELGFGQGISVNIHAAASNAHWYGTDFNPTHAAFARSLAATSGSGASLFDQSFVEFCGRSDLPDFDFIGLHGVLSWVSEENERVVVDFIRRKLKPGGVVYLSYNTQPGHAATLPLRLLLSQHARIMAAPGSPLLARIDGALEFAERLMALSPAFAAAYPPVLDRLKAMKSHDRHYLAHEYFNRDWRALQFVEMAEILAVAKLNYACSAYYLDHLDALNATEEQLRFLAEIADPVFYQSVKDFIVNQQFRRDYWVKGARRLTRLEQTELLRQIRLMLVAGPGDIAYTVQGAAGSRDLNASVYNPILDMLADHEPKTIGEIETALSGGRLRLAEIYEAVMVLAGKGDLVLVQPEESREGAKTRTDKFNDWVLDKARTGGDLAYLASPVTGGGVAAAHFNQLFLLGRRHGRKTADDLAQFAWDILGRQGQRVVKDGKALETVDENLAELGGQARDFTDRRLDIFGKLQIAD